MRNMKSTASYLLVLITLSRFASSFGEDLPLRLVGGAGPHEGRVEIFLNDTWGTVCDDFFTEYEGAVVCSQLNYTGVLSITHFGPGNGNILLDDVHCDCTNASSLLDCSHKRNHDCAHSEDVGVICNTHNPGVEGAIQLVEGRNASEGRVEIFHNGEWGTVCDRGWDINNAHVVCRELGFRGAISLTPHTAYPSGVGRIWLKDVNCSGEEDRLIDCRYVDEVCTECAHRYDIGVTCVPGLVMDATSTTTIATEALLPITSKPVATPKTTTNTHGVATSVDMTTATIASASTEQDVPMSINQEITMLQAATLSATVSTPTSPDYTSGPPNNSQYEDTAIVIAVASSITIVLLVVAVTTLIILLLLQSSRRKILTIYSRSAQDESLVDKHDKLLCPTHVSVQKQ